MNSSQLSGSKGWVLAGLTLALLVSCGSSQSTTGSPVPAESAPVVLNSDGQAVNTPTASYPYAVSLKITGADTPEALQAAYDAQIVSFQPEDGFALLATKTDQLPADPLHAPTVERNANTISGGGMTAKISGSARTWARGSISSWASGSARTWARGEYSPIPENSTLWKQLHLEEAQATATKLGAGVKVAIIDTGIDPNHPAFVGSLAPKNEWHDFYGDDADPTDSGVPGQGGSGHGSNVAGIVLQIAPKATILPLRALGPDGGGDVLSIARAIDWAVARGSNIINLSLGSTERSQAIQDAILRANLMGVMVTASAGNENRNKLDYPAADARLGSMTFSVGSVNGADVKSDFSNYGGTLELTAPGELVFGPAPGQDTQGNWNMAAWSGTSMTAPMAAGALALELAEVGGQRNTIVSTYLASRLLGTTVDVDSLNGNKSYKKLLGQGRLDIKRFIYGDDSKSAAISSGTKTGL
ncbi:S8 family serine peptidase [Deinococcus altitudinis]|uniref:S8 family serine peptidase n=1 Tax=Deinococcus altitudinis TaxID=468914 RepID=UPI003892C760